MNASAVYDKVTSSVVLLLLVEYCSRMQAKLVTAANISKTFIGNPPLTEFESSLFVLCTLHIDNLWCFKLKAQLPKFQVSCVCAERATK